MRLDFTFGAGDRFGDAGFVERFQYIVDGVYIESLHRVGIVSGGENYMRHFHFALDQLFQYAKAIEAGHLHIEENQIRRVFFDQRYGFYAVAPLADQINFGEGFQ